MRAWSSLLDSRNYRRSAPDCWHTLGSVRNRCASSTSRAEISIHGSRLQIKLEALEDDRQDLSGEKRPRNVSWFLWPAFAAIPFCRLGRRNYRRFWAALLQQVRAG